MKTLEQIYEGIRGRFYKKTNIDVKQGTTIDYFVLASSEMIESAHQEIEDNKTPHIYTNLSGDKIDNMGILCGVTRRADESDKNFLYRVLKWNVSNKASNETAIDTALMDMKYCSNVTYVPHAFGCGTSAAYIIPKNMDSEGRKIAIEETKAMLKDVVSPSTYVEYIIPDVTPIAMTIAYKSSASDLAAIKKNIGTKIVEYVNGIAPGSYLEVGEINKMGIKESNVDYFNVAHFIVDGKETGSVSILQKVESKFLMSVSNIKWLEVE